MKTVLACGLAAALLAACAASAEQPTSKTTVGRSLGDAAAGPVGMTSAATLGSMNTHAFVENAARSDMYELQAAHLAVERTKNPAVKRFAERMIHDHTMTTRELKAHLPADVTPPTELDARRSGLLDDLRNSKDFDKRYADQQVAAHEEALTLMRGFAKRGDNPALKALAAKTVPLIEHHLQMARQLKAQVHG